MGKKHTLRQKDKERLLGATDACGLVILGLVACLLSSAKIVVGIIQHLDAQIPRTASIAEDSIKRHQVNAQCFSQNLRTFSLKTFCRSTNMKLLSLNCQSYKTAKIDIYNLEDSYNLDIMCLSETWETEKEKVYFKNWTVHSKARKSNSHGGVAILCKPSQNFISERITAYDLEDVEALYIHVRPEKLQSFLLIVAYIPPSKSEQLTKLLDMIKKAEEKYRNIILTGDLNSKSLLGKQGKKY